MLFCCIKDITFKYKILTISSLAKIFFIIFVIEYFFLKNNILFAAEKISKTTSYTQFQLDTAVNRDELRKLLKDVFPESYLTEHKSITDIYSCAIEHLSSRMLLDRINMSNQVGYWNNASNSRFPVWSDISIYTNVGAAYKYYPIASWKNTIATLGIDSSLDRNLFGLMVNYGDTKLQVYTNLQSDHFSLAEYMKTKRNTRSHTIIGTTYYQYLHPKIAVNLAVMVGRVKEIKHKDILTINTSYNINYTTSLVGFMLKINYPYSIGKFHIEAMLQNSFTSLSIPDVILEKSSNIKKSTTNIIASATGISASYLVSLSNKYSLYYTANISYNYSFYLDGYSKLDITYFGKELYMQNYFNIKHSLNTNFIVNVKFGKNFNIGLSLSWIKKPYNNSLGSRLLIYYGF